MATVLWQRLPRETDTQWAYFLVFRDWAYPDGPTGQYRPRDLASVAAELGISPNTAGQHAQGASWYIRAAAYDRELEEAKVNRSLTAIARMRIRKEKVLGDFDRILELERAKLLKMAEDPDKPAISVREMTALTELIMKHEALLHGMEDTSEGSVLDFEAMEDEDLDRLDTLAKKYSKGVG